MKHFLIALLFLINTCAPAYGQSLQRVVSADVIEGVVAPVNLVPNGNFSKTSQGWLGYSGSGAQPTSASGGVLGGDPVIIRTTDNSFNTTGVAGSINKTANNRQGSGVTVSLRNLDASKGRVLTLSFDYKLASGTFVNADPNDLTSAGDSSLTVWVRDEGNSLIIQPSQYRLYDVSTDKVGKFTATFQLASNASGVSVLFHQARTESSAYNFRIANVTVSEVPVTMGPIITDWQSYAPTLTNNSGSISNYTQEAQYRRNGDNIEISGKIIFSAASAVFSGLRVSLPNGLIADSTKLKNNKAGGAGFIDTGVTVYDGVTEATAGSNLFYIYVSVANSTYGSWSSPTNAIPFTYGSGDVISYNAVIPVQGWSSNATLSSSSSNKQIVFVGYKSAGQAVTANVTDITYSAQRDYSGAWNGSQFTVQEPGDYLIVSSGNASGATTVKAFVNGVAQKQFYDWNSATNTSGSTILFGLTAGQTISLRVGNTLTVNGGASDSVFNLSIYKLANPQTIAASDTISAIYSDTSGATLQTSQTVFKYTTKVKDTHSAYNTSTGLFTAPEPGLYRISYTLASSGASSLSTTQRFASYVVANGATITGTKMHGIGAATSLFTTLSTEYPLLAGQTLQVQAAIDVSQAALSTAGFNILSIMKVGNY